MEPLPEDVEATLLRGVAAYLRATPTNELPPKLRRFQNFRPKGMSAHRRQIVDALDDEAFRALVAEWLEEKPSLSRPDADVLRLAVARDAGWHGKLTAASAPRAVAAKAAPSPDEAAERERVKILKGRDEARKKLEESQRELQQLHRRVDELEQESNRSRDLRASLEKELAVARKATEKAAATVEREQRKSRGALEKAEAVASKARADLKEARRELQAVRRELDRSKAKPQPKPPARKKAGAPRGPRRAIPVPKGRFEDDPATLESWLGTDGVHLLVDGYNASMSRSGFAHLDLADQRQRLVDAVTKLARRTGVPATVVFDGSDVSGVVRQPRGPAKIQYSAADEIADDHLIGLIESMPQVPVIVATSDRELQERASSLGATVATSEQLLHLLR